MTRLILSAFGETSRSRRDCGNPAAAVTVLRSDGRLPAAVASGAGPVHELKGFQKAELGAGEARDLEFTVSDRELG